MTERSERTSTPNVWQDPRTWVSILGFLLSLSVVASSYVGSQLSQLRDDVKGLTKSTVEQTGETKNLRERVEKLERNQADQNAYNFNLKSDLVEIKTLLKERKQQSR